MKQCVLPAALALGCVYGVPGGSALALVAFSCPSVVHTAKSTTETQLSLAEERRNVSLLLLSRKSWKQWMLRLNDKNKKISHFTKPAPWWGRMGTTDEFRTSAAGTSLAQVDKGVSCVCVPSLAVILKPSAYCHSKLYNPISVLVQC